MTLEQFCEEHDLPCPQDNREFVLRPASPNEAGLFYSELEPEKDEALGTIGHVRMDFGHGGRSSGIAGGLITGTGSIPRSLKRCYSDW